MFVAFTRLRNKSVNFMAKLYLQETQDITYPRYDLALAIVLF